MPKSPKNPQTGSLVWYFAAPGPASPIAALVVGVVDFSTATEIGHMNLATFGKADGVMTFVGNVLFTMAGPPAAGAWCTNIRVYESTATVSPAAMETGVSHSPAAMGSNDPDLKPAAGNGEPDDDDDDDEPVTVSRTRTTTVSRQTHR